MLWILALGYQEGKSDENAFVHIILNIVLIMIGICWCVVKATKNKKLKDLSSILTFFIRSMYLKYNKGV